MSNHQENRQEQRPMSAMRPMGGPGGGRHQTTERASDFVGSVRRVIGEVFVYKWRALLVVVSAIMATLLQILGPRELGRATTELFEGVRRQMAGTGGIDFQAVGSILLFVLGLYVFGAFFEIIQGFVMSTITQQITYSLRKRASEKIDRLPMSYFENRPYGEVLSIITNDIDMLSNGLNQSITTIVTSVLMLSGIIWVMFSINWLMGMIVLTLLPISLIIVFLLMRYSQKFFREQQAALARLNGQVEEVYSGQMIVQAFNQEDEVIDAFMKENQILRETAWKSQFFSALMHPFIRFVSSLGYIGVAISGSFLAFQGVVTVGEIQAFTQYVERFTQPITQVAQVLNLMQSMAAAGERVYAFLDQEEEAELGQETLDVAKVQGKVDFNQVHFGYNDSQIIVHDFNSTAAIGQKIAIVGPTGAGKSTMVKLLMRFYEIDDGAIYLDEQNIQQYTRRSYRQAISMVLQDTWLFTGSIKDNIRYGRLDATDEEIQAAAQAAGVDQFIENQPGGYDFEINEAVTNLSQGQQQLLTIARAILADRPVLILDEATSSVDTRTEKLIQKAMEEMMEGRTSFVIAHRLSTIQDADLILYLEDGDVKEQGTHEELLAQEGKYAHLYNSQFSMET